MNCEPASLYGVRRRCHGRVLIVIAHVVCTFLSALHGNRSATAFAQEASARTPGQISQTDGAKPVAGIRSYVFSDGFPIICPDELLDDLDDEPCARVSIYTDGAINTRHVKNLSRFPKSVDLRVYCIQNTAKQRIQIDLSPLRDLKNLRRLEVDVCPVNAVGQTAVLLDDLASIARHPSLTNLKCVGCELSPIAVRNIASIPNLKALIAVNCGFPHNSLTQLQRTRSLTCLNLEASDIAEMSIATLGKQLRLKHLKVSKTNATFDDFSAAADWDGLRVLDISHSRASGTGLANLGRLKNLVALNLGGLVVTQGQINTLVAASPSLKVLAVPRELVSSSLSNGLPRQVDLMAAPDDVSEASVLGQRGLEKRSPIFQTILEMPDVRSEEDCQTLYAVENAGDRVFCNVHNLADSFHWTALAKVSGVQGFVITRGYSLPSGLSKARVGDYQEAFGRLFQGWSKSRYLEEIELRGCELGNSGRHLQEIKTLRAVSIVACDTDESIGKEIAKLPRLERLRICRGSKATDKTVAGLMGARHLAYLDLSNTEVSDDSVASLLRLEALKEIHLHGTKVSGTGVDRLRGKGIIVGWSAEDSKDEHWLYRGWTTYKDGSLLYRIQ